MMNFSEFIKELKNYGLKVACDNWLILFTQWFIGAKRVQITYLKKKGGVK